MESKKWYGLTISKKAAKVNTKGKSVFESDDSDDNVEDHVRVKKEPPSTSKEKKKVPLESKPEEVDPTIYEYDSIYDEMKASQKQKTSHTKSKEPRYINLLLKAAERRKKEGERRVERKIQAERVKEGDAFKDKEAFVTSAYRKKMLEMEEEEERERRENALEGYNDVGWNNPGIKTPHLDELARNGVIMNQSYVQPLCTPSRSAFMTGYYPYHLGRQNCVVIVMEPTGIPTKHVFLPQKLKELDYSTHIIGKWHLGHCNVSYTPTHRGFDSFLGFYYAEGDYYKHTIESSIQMWREILDFHRDLTPTDEFRGMYTTDVMKNAVTDLLSRSDPAVPLFLYLPFQAAHSPLQVPNEYEQMYSHVRNRERRIFSGMVTALDDAVGSLVSDMKRYGFWDNFLIVFISDNGADVLGGGNNWPLRGSKMTMWEGGTRVPTFVYGDVLKQKGYVNENMIHAVDWFPTLLGAAGSHANDIPMDGVNQWDSISENGSPARNEFVYNIYDVDNSRAAIRMGDHKLILGYPGLPCDWSPVSTKFEGLDLEKTCRKSQINDGGIYLFNIKDDPREKTNLARSNPSLVRKMKQRLEEMSQTMVPADDPFPNFFAMGRITRGGALVPGWCEAK